MGFPVDLQVRLAIAEACVMRGEDYLRRMQALIDQATALRQPTESKQGVLRELQQMQAEFIANRDRLARALSAEGTGRAPR